MNKEQAIELFENLIKYAENAQSTFDVGDVNYYTNEALISAYKLTISVVKVLELERGDFSEK